MGFLPSRPVRCHQNRHGARCTALADRDHTLTFPAMTKIAALPARGVLAVTGEDRVAFLQGLVSNDVAEAQPGRAVWAALLTPQGKWLADFFILSDGERLLLDCELAQLPMLRQRLARYRLRSRAALDDAGLNVYVAWDGKPGDSGIVAPDPRLPRAGWRILTASAIAANATETDWDVHRLALGLPDGSRDMETEKSVLLEAGFDELNGVSWTKGCYMGQELTARTKYRGLLKRRLVPIRIEGAIPAPGAAIMLDGREVGTMRSAQGTHGMAVVRLEALGSALISDGATVTPVVPEWMRVG
jgi:folate-binding protein YgfZ